MNEIVIEDEIANIMQRVEELTTLSYKVKFIKNMLSFQVSLFLMNYQANFYIPLEIYKTAYDFNLMLKNSIKKSVIDLALKSFTTEKLT